MQEEKLQRIEQEMLKSMDDEINLESQLHEQAVVAAHDLMKRHKATIETQGVVYDLVANISEKKMLIVAADKVKLKLLQGKYRPYFIGVDVNNSLSTEANLSAAVEAWLRHKYGMTDVQEVE